MEIITIDAGIKVFFITALSFPDGIMDAYNKLHELVPSPANRTFYGISRPENGVIVYRAAAEELQEGEAEKLGCDTLILKKGRYISSTINDYAQDLPGISRAFQEILAQPGIDPNGYCVEWYFNDKDVKCIVRMEEE